jgi:hypothetical protein
MNLDDRPLAAGLARRVLQRLGFQDRPTPDLGGLSALYRAWCQAVPFDNTRKMIALAARGGEALPGATAETSSSTGSPTARAGRAGRRATRSGRCSGPQASTPGALSPRCAMPAGSTTPASRCARRGDWRSFRRIEATGGGEPPPSAAHDLTGLVSGEKTRR